MFRNYGGFRGPESFYIISTVVRYKRKKFALAADKGDLTFEPCYQEVRTLVPKLGLDSVEDVINILLINRMCE